MTKTDKFAKAIKSIQERQLSTDKETEYMSNMSNWCMVHATRYVPHRSSDGAVYIPSTGMATDFKFVRSTVHVTLNHIVESHGGGSWDDASFVVLAPYNDVVKQNGDPVEIAGVDTYWSVDPDTGLVLPKSAYIVQPDNNGPLYKIGKDGATYKRDNYTEEEIKQIESWLDDFDESDDYKRYKVGDFTPFEIQEAMKRDKRVRQVYDSIESDEGKKEFLIGLFEEARFEILAKFLRDHVVALAMQKMGFEYIYSVHDSNATSETIAKVADEHGIQSSVNNKGHSGSTYIALENEQDLIRGTLYGEPGLLKAKDIESVYNILSQQDGNPVLWEILLSIVNNRAVDFEQMYKDAYTADIEGKIDYVKDNMQTDIQDLKRHQEGFYDADQNPDIRAKYIKKYQDIIVANNEYIKNASARKTLAKGDKNLAKTVHRHCKRLMADYNAWHTELAKNPEYENLVKRLRSIVPIEVLQSHDYKGR